MKIDPSQSQDQVVLVDSDDNQIGVMDKVEAHRGKARLHRAISVYLFRKKDDSVEVLLQQRSQHKIVGAGQWANTVCGNVWPGESYLECAQRRLKVELAITDAKLAPQYKFEYQVKCNEEFSEHEMDQVFFGWWDGECVPNPQEVSEVEWVDFEALLKAAGEQEWQPENSLIWEGKELAPWFIWMVRDEQLTKISYKYLSLKKLFLKTKDVGSPLDNLTRDDIYEE